MVYDWGIGEMISPKGVNLNSTLRNKYNGTDLVFLFKDGLSFIIPTVQNICNLTGQEEYNIGLIVILTSILYSLTKKSNN